MSADFTTKFQLASLTAVKLSYYDKDTSSYKMRPAVTVRFSAVKDPIFGEYTPNGEITMTIANPQVVAELTELWTSYVNDPDPGATAPEYSVPFNHLHALQVA